MTAQTRRGFFGRAFGGFLAAVGLEKVASNLRFRVQNATTGHYLYAGGEWHGPFDPQDFLPPARCINAETGEPGPWLVMGHENVPQPYLDYFRGRS